MQTDEFILQAVKEVDVNRLPAGAQKSAQALITAWASQYGIQRPDHLNMKPSPCSGDEVAKLLDDGYWVVIYHNRLGSFTAVALGESESDTINDVRECIEDIDDESRITDDFTPTKALARLAEKLGVTP
jgi:hypothetical protein